MINKNIVVFADDAEIFSKLSKKIKITIVTAIENIFGKKKQIYD